MSNVPKLRFGEFDGEWSLHSIGDLSDCIVPGRNKPKSFDGSIPWITTPDISSKYILGSETELRITTDEAQRTGNRVVPVDSIIMSCVGELGVTAINKTPIVINQQLHAFLPQDNQSVEFLAYQIGRQTKYMEIVATKTSVPYMNKQSCNSIPITLPTPSEQQKIAAFLTAVDTKIEQLTQKEALLKQYKKGVMQKLFSQEIRFKADDGNEFPEWSNAKLSQVADVVGGGTPDTSISDYWDGEIDWFTPTEIKTKYLGHSARKISEKGLAKSSAKLLPVGTLLLSTRATVGDVGISTAPCTTNQGFQSLVVNDQNDHEFVYYWICFNKRELVRRASGSTFLEIGKKELSQIIIQSPSLEEQSKIASFLQSLDSKLMHLADQLTSAKTFKKGLLQQMFV
ncbi:restriction endonuclease subunit S [Marinobacterium sp. xm-m-312]|uniref:restriction endonuclease subunit S n=1 Tax=Marinobacterium sp. xm-m-312 TaxID=2497741 RepID=UPI00156A0267|nr:restriction endonuclease subunit S [Marinobacterium sp. xm-m-312]NRQ24562.1 EcoKI restriction-modification system protein HsdS [Marinobacterium sp. xm-m-312]